jgi:plasmid stability protein
MAQLIVRNIEKSLVESLKRRATRHKRSAEAEHREILRQALGGRPGSSIKRHLMVMPTVGDDADFEIVRSKSRRLVKL